METTVEFDKKNGRSITVECDSNTLQACFEVSSIFIRLMRERLERMDSSKLSGIDLESYLMVSQWAEEVDDEMESFIDAFMDMPGKADFFYKQQGHLWSKSEQGGDAESN